MIGFILCSVTLAVLAQSRNELLRLLATPEALTVGLAVAAAGLLAGYARKAPLSLCHDAFASGCLLAWYAYWSPQFDQDAPMFFFFPLYYALLTSLVTLAFINRRQYFDQESIDSLRYLDKISRFGINALALLALASLLFPENYMLYPIAMTLFIIRHTMNVCLEGAGRAY